ncbi:hydrolase [Photobacterium proteolyticum]|uniref:Hydrolase n=1 Tax=Photobacterium proteolyticum TaxID=1903952 RepID=A0A1Q9GBM0_9GAMM|nr:alpha/beta fold hydrolase [Photobacterium proteolyticum]OLQ71716.1 hydrolase [Photobacterium proteolyticum]
MHLSKPEKLLVYLIFVLFLTGCESLFFWPSKKMVPSPEYFNFTKQDRYFTSEDGTIIHSWHLPASKEKRGTIFFLHGNAQNLSYHVANVYWLIDKGWDVVIIDYRGYGRSAGSPNFGAVQQDALAGYKALLAQQPDNLPIIVWGQSLGAAIAINLTASLPHKDLPQGVIIDSGFSSPRKIMQETLGKSWITWLFQYPLSWSITTEYSPDQAIVKIKDIPLLFVHSANDPLINSKHAETLFDLAKSPKQLWISQQQGHNTIWNDEQWREKLSCQLSNWPTLQPVEEACKPQQSLDDT